MRNAAGSHEGEGLFGISPTGKGTRRRAKIMKRFVLPPFLLLACCIGSWGVPKPKRCQQPQQGGQPAVPCLTCSNGEEGYTLQEVYFGVGSDGNYTATYEILVNTTGNGQIDATSQSTWTSSNPSVVQVNGPGVVEYLNLDAGAVTDVTVTFPIQIFNCNTGCETIYVRISWKSATAITYANYTGSTQPDGLGIQDCGATQVGACTPATMPVLAPINGVRIGNQYSCSGPPAGAQWQVISKCWGYGSLGPYCTSIPGLTGSGLSTTPKACTPLSVWPQ